MKRILSFTLCLVLLLSAFPLAASVSAEEEYTEAELTEMFGSVATMEISGTADYQKAREVFNLINQERKAAGKFAVKLDGKLTAAAMQRAAESAVMFYHLRPDISAIATVLPGKILIGECLIAGATSAVEMMAACMSTDEYSGFILDSYGETARSVGVGVFRAGSTYYWVILFSKNESSTTLTQATAISNKRFKVNFRTKAVGLEANETEVKLNPSETFTIKVTNLNQFYPIEKLTMYAGGFKYTSSDTSVATVNSKGCITAKSGGSATITVKGSNGVSLLKISVDVSSPQLNAYMSTGTGGIPKVIWNRVDGATHYKVRYKIYKNGAWTRYYTTKLQKTEYQYLSIKGGQKIHFIVNAYDGDTLLDSQSLTAMYLERPTVYLNAVSGGLKVSWKAVEQASYYTVYRSVYRNGKWGTAAKYKTTKELSFVDAKVKNNTKVRYYVYARCGEYTSVKGQKTIKYEAIPEITVTNTAKGVKIAWKANGYSDFRIRKRINTKGDAYKSAGTVRIKNGKYSYTDTEVKSGQKIRYDIDSHKGESAYSGTCIDALYLKQPTLKLSKATKGVKGTWKKVSGATHYRVYKSVYQKGKWTDYEYYKSTKTTSFADTSVKKGAKVRYTVYAVNGEFKSAFKTGVSIKR